MPNKINFNLAYSGSRIKNTLPENIKLIEIESITNNNELYLDNDIVYCPFKNEPLGLVPLEALLFGCLLFADKTIPSINDYKDMCFMIPNSIELECLLWLEFLENIISIKKYKLVRRDKFLKIAKKYIL